MRRSWVSLSVVVLSCALSVTPPALAISLNFVTIDVPGAAATSAGGINDAGQIVGTFGDAGGKQHGYVRTGGGAFTTIDAPGATAPDAPALGINNAGQIVGTFVDADRKSHGYLRTSEGTFTTIDAPGATATLAAGINDAGQIVGSFQDGGGKGHGYVAIPTQ